MLSLMATVDRGSYPVRSWNDEILIGDCVRNVDEYSCQVYLFSYFLLARLDLPI